MTQPWSALSIIIAVVSLVSYMHGMFLSTPMRRDNVLYELDKELYETVVKPNIGKYGFYGSPQMSWNGLTYVIEIDVLLKNAKLLSIDEVKLVHKHIYRDLFERINSIRTIRPFLAEFPLTAKSVYLNIFFLDERGEKCRPPYFSSIITREKKIQFIQIIYPDINSETRKTSFPEKKIIKEIPISDAEWLKDSLSISIPRSKVENYIKIPEYLEPSPRAFSIGEALFLFEAQFCKAHNLHIVTTGCAGITEKDSRAFDFVLRGQKWLDLIEAKRIGGACGRDLLRYVRENKACLEYLKDRSTWKNLKDPTTFPEPRHLAFRISFWDDNVDRWPAPAISEIRLFDEKLQYFTSDENQSLILVHEESFDDAVRALDVTKSTTKEEK
jgi:hypothetical protein